MNAGNSPRIPLRMSLPAPGENVVVEEPLQAMISLPYQQHDPFINHSSQYIHPNISNPGSIRFAATQGPSNSALLQVPMNYTIPSNVYSMPPGMWTGCPGQVTCRVIHHTHTPSGTQDDNITVVGRDHRMEDVVFTSRPVIEYLDRIKMALGQEVYNNFLVVMEKYRNKSINTETCVERVTSLLHGYPDLIEEFLTFCPHGHTITIEKATDSIQALNDYDDYIFQAQAHQEQMTPGLSERTPTEIGLSYENRPAVVGSYETVGGDSPPLAIVAGRTSPLLCNQENQSQQDITAEQYKNQALAFVNKIKNRFQERPEVYNKFLEILHAFQKQQRSQSRSGDNSGMLMTDLEVQAQVTRLFYGHEDLLKEFSVFYANPEPTQFHSPSRQYYSNFEHTPPSQGQGSSIMNINHGVVTEKARKSGKKSSENPSLAASPAGKKQQGTKRKRETVPRKTQAKNTETATSSAKKPKAVGARAAKTSLAKVGPSRKLSFFEKVHNHLKNKAVYINFVGLLLDFNYDQIRKEDVMKVAVPLLANSPGLLLELKNLIGYVEPSQAPNEVIPKRRLTGQQEDHEIDYTTCRRLATSYVALPKAYRGPSCSGRDYLCKEVLNDVWYSFPCWMGESPYCTTKKSAQEDNLNRVEHDRFEVDFVIDSNTATIHDLLMVSVKMNKMSKEELENFELDDKLGGTSDVINIRSIKRIYGEKASIEVIEGLKECPRLVVPIVLKRLEQKDQEWREQLKGFKENWREQTQRYMSKNQSSSKRH